MLIIAVPKSASSALIATLERIHGLPNETAQVRRGPIRRCALAHEYRQLERFHRHEVAELSEEVVAAVTRKTSLAKLHFPPTRNNQALLASSPKVILLRDPEEVVHAYQRGDETGEFKLRHPRFCFCFSQAAWMHRARELGVLDELRRFVDGWRAHAGDKLLVESRELIERPAEALARIEDYLGLTHSGAPELARVRFTRGRAARRSIPRVLWSRRKLIAQRALGALGHPRHRTPVRTRS